MEIVEKVAQLTADDLHLQYATQIIMHATENQKIFRHIWGIKTSGMKVFVSGCYDMLHSGHVAFFKEAASYGDLYVGIGSDRTIEELKGRKTINSEQERLYMVKSIRYVTGAWINSGSGILDFVDELRHLKPDRYVVNEDGHSPAKADLCRELGIV